MAASRRYCCVIFLNVIGCNVTTLHHIVFAVLRSASFLSKVLQVNDKPVKFQIWDTAGQEKV